MLLDISVNTLSNNNHSSSHTKNIIKKKKKKIQKYEVLYKNPYVNKNYT